MQRHLTFHRNVIPLSLPTESEVQAGKLFHLDIRGICPKRLPLPTRIDFTSPFLYQLGLSGYHNILWLVFANAGRLNKVLCLEDFLYY